jgi:hypothetical protein
MGWLDSRAAKGCCRWRAAGSEALQMPLLWSAEDNQGQALPGYRDSRRSPSRHPQLSKAFTPNWRLGAKTVTDDI